MKVFEVPAVEVVHFDQKDVIVTSIPCKCVDCGECGDDKNNCPCNDFEWANQ